MTDKILSKTIVRLITIALTLLAGFADQSSSKAIPPLDGEICLTSSFGSWRRSHIHAGLDFSTGRKIGARVYAIDSCKVLRINISSYGYGKALYLLLNDGKVAVYGHLSGFVPELESIVEDVQDSLGAYQVDILLKDRDIRFMPGDVVAYSGETGAGPPHLHFEIRSDENDFSRINPLIFFPEFSDSLPPLIRAVSLEPIGPNASVNGQTGAVRLARAQKYGPVRISGKVGIAVDAIDPVGCGNYLLPHQYELLVDGVAVWRLTFDRFDFSLRHFVSAIYEIVGQRRLVRLYPYNDIEYLGFKESNSNLISGPYELIPGRHSLCTRVCDFWGNCDSLSFDAIVERKPRLLGFDLSHENGSTRVKVRGEQETKINLTWSILGSTSKKSLTGLCSLENVLTNDTRPVTVVCSLEDKYGSVTNGHFSTYQFKTDDRCDLRIETKPSFIEVLATCTTPPRSLPIAMVNKPIPTSITLQPVGRNKFVGWILNDQAAGAKDITVGFEYVNGWLFCKEEIKSLWISPGESLTFDQSRLRLTLSNPKDGGYGAFIAVQFKAAGTFEGFESDGIRIEFEPEDLLFPKGIDVSISLKLPNDRIGASVYSLERGVPYFLASLDQNGSACFKIYKLNPIVVLRDLQPPTLTLGGIRLRNDGKAVFSGAAHDRGSGIDPGLLTGYIDGKKAVVGIDPDTGRLDGRSTIPLSYGKHRIRLEAVDRAGNRNAIESVFNLVR